MPRAIHKVAGRGTIAHWNGLDTLGRLKLILEYQNLFLALELVTADELELIQRLSPTEWEYIVTREEHPIFITLDLKSPVEFQSFAHKLKAVLEAIF